MASLPHDEAKESRSTLPRILRRMVRAGALCRKSGRASTTTDESAVGERKLLRR
jgi:hypothetical protein